MSSSNPTQIIDTFNSTPKLYHFTSIKSLLGIIESKTLRFSPLARMNDITEASKEIYIEHNENHPHWNIINKVEDELKNVGQISLTMDGILPGFAINSMWGHYADKGEGCCIVFNRDIILMKCNKLGFKYGEIIYDGAQPDLLILSKGEIENIIESKFDDFFLHKSIDWASEQELRIVNFNMNDDSSELPINDSIIAVILHTNCKHSIFNCQAKIALLKQIGDIPILEYHYSKIWGNDSNLMLSDKTGQNWVGNDLLNYSIDI